VRVQRQVRDLSSRRSSSQTLRQSGHNKQRVVLVLLRSVTPDQPHCGHLATIRVSESPFGDGYESSISIRRLTNRDLAARPFKEREPSRSSNTQRFGTNQIVCPVSSWADVPQRYESVSRTIGILWEVCLAAQGPTRACWKRVLKRADSADDDAAMQRFEEQHAQLQRIATEGGKGHRKRAQSAAMRDDKPRLSSTDSH
jgi:hypothetical protein